MRILALTKYGSMAASTRQRFMQYGDALEDAGFAIDYAPLFGNAHMVRLSAGRRASPFAILFAYARRLFILLRARHYDVLWVHYELFPFWPGITERMASLWSIPIVYDFDDAIFHMYDESSNPIVRRLLGRKLEPLLRSADVCCCGNEYLRQYAMISCENSVILPTVVDTERYRPVVITPKNPLVIGWIGSPTTWRFMRPLLPILRDLVEEFGCLVRTVGAGDEARQDYFPGLQFVDWTEDSEIAEVQGMDIGIMPLPDEPWARGKCGYKLVQYMACGLPVVASPVGVNATIVDNGATGILATDPAQWRNALVRLINDAELRQRMGQAGRTRAVEEFSLHVHAPRLVEIMKRVLKGRA